MSHLNTIDIINAWKDPEYRLSLSEAERMQLPEHPAGLIELTDVELGDIQGGKGGGGCFGSDMQLGAAASSHHNPKVCCSTAPAGCTPPPPPPPPDGGAPRPDGGAPGGVG